MARPSALLPLWRQQSIAVELTAGRYTPRIVRVDREPPAATTARRHNLLRRDREARQEIRDRLARHRTHHATPSVATTHVRSA